MAAGCAPKSHLCVDQLLEQELREDCLLLRLSQWFGSPSVDAPGGHWLPGRRVGNAAFSTLAFVECHLPGKLLPWSHTALPGGCDPPRGVERLPFPRRMGGNRILDSLSFWLYPPARGELRSLGRSCWSVPALAAPAHFVL
ncbi:hypothetical protein Nmel_016790 [Mimus melanotis]